MANSPVRNARFLPMIRGSVFLLSSVFATALLAQDIPEQLRDKLDQSIVAASQNQLAIEAITPTPLDNIFEVELNTGEILYSDATGDYLFAGDMYQTTEAGLLNLSDHEAASSAP